MAGETPAFFFFRKVGEMLYIISEQVKKKRLVNVLPVMVSRSDTGRKGIVFHHDSEWYFVITGCQPVGPHESMEHARAKAREALIPYGD